MRLEELRVREILGVVRYNSAARRWNAVNRADHIVGIKLSGSANHTFSDRSFVISKDCVYFINQRDDYRVEVYEPGESFSIHFTTDEEIETESFCVPAAHAGRMLSILQKSEIASDVGDELSLLSLLYRFCAELMRSRDREASYVDPRICEARQYMDLHFREDGCMREAIAGSGVGERRFGTLFKNAYDVTPAKYITLRRIENAKRLLSTKSLSVCEIATLCGFSDVYYFSKVFKAETGVPPSRFSYDE